MQRVIGQGIDGSSVHIVFARTEIPCKKASYEDGLEKEDGVFMGSQRIDEQSDGTYKTGDVSITMSTVVFRTELMPRLPVNGFGNMRTSVIVGWDHPDQGSDSDQLDGFRIMNLAQAVENSNKLEEVELKCSTTQIYWTDARMTINRMNTAVPLGESSL